MAFILPLSAAGKNPNVIFIMADDQGYGDASSYNPESKIPTPGLDRIAREGIRFTDAHSASSVCTPTRYGLLTGRYPWRSRLQAGVMVTGENGGCLIDESILTVPEFLKQHGYRNALVGKWHLGYKYEFPQGADGLKNVVTRKPYGVFNVLSAPIGSKIIGGPIEHGFDIFQGFHHAREMHSWSKNDTVVESIPLDQVISRSTQESIRFIENQAGDKEPFFLYLALGSPHTPIIPSDDWVGKSSIGLYGDFVMEPITPSCVSSMPWIDSRSPITPSFFSRPITAALPLRICRHSGKKDTTPVTRSGGIRRMCGMEVTACLMSCVGLG